VAGGGAAAAVGAAAAASGEATTTTTPPAVAPCVPTLGREYVLSGGPDPSAHFNVDDVLRVFLNGVLIAQGTICFPDIRQCPGSAPIRFRGNTGDTLTLEAQDANNCYSLDALFLQKDDGTCLRQLNSRISGPNCGSEPPMQVFFRESYTLP
jgi:hypothetical protein